MGLTTEQERLKKRAQRAKARQAAGDTPRDNVRSILSTPSNAPAEFVVFESNEAAVREEIKTMPLAASRPTDVARAITLAKILDDRQAANRVGADARLEAVMETLRGGGSNAVNPLRALIDRRTTG